VVVRVSRRGKAHMRFSVSRLKRIYKYDILNIPDGFSYVAKNRKIFKHKSGGIVVVDKNNLKNHIKFKYLIMTFYWDVYFHVFFYKIY
jgi:hypothetical protein